MSLDVVAVVAFVLASVPATMLLLNLAVFRSPSARTARDGAVSVLIPARNEEKSIAAAVESALATRGVEVEVIVMDDQSTDRTAPIVAAIAARDPRVRLLSAPPLPAGWCGKQHACDALARVARHSVLLFIDADVRIAEDGIQRLLGFLESSKADLVSGVPRQITGSLAERLVVPLIQFVLLGFLPVAAMRRSASPGFSAGCGQLMMASRAAYESVGGHGAIRASRHDGIALPRAFRRAGYRTDLCDATPLATCRMYRDLAGVWQGFAKNATEGMAAPGAILPWTLLLFGGQVLPSLLLVSGAIGSGPALAATVLAVALAFGTRFALTLRFRQSWIGAVLHPVGVTLVVAIQWYALLQKLMGRELAWKGRTSVAGS